MSSKAKATNCARLSSANDQVGREKVTNFFFFFFLKIEGSPPFFRNPQADLPSVVSGQWPFGCSHVLDNTSLFSDAIPLLYRTAVANNTYW
jgi:hypothetical protein